MTATQRRPYRLPALFLLAFSAALPARAADSYLKIVPSDALAFGAVNHMSDASAKILKLTTLVQAGAGNALDSIKSETGIKNGLDEKSAAGFIVLPGKKEKDPYAVCFVAVTDYKAFLGNFEVVRAGEKVTEFKVKSPRAGSKSQYMAERGGYALIAMNGDRAALDAVLDAKQDITAEMTGMDSWSMENDATAVGTAAGIKLAAKLATESLKGSKGDLGAGPEAAVLNSVMEYYGKAMAAAPKEMALALAGIRCDDQNSIRVTARAKLVNGGEVSKALAGIPAVHENLVAGVPGGPFFVAFGGVSVASIMEGYMNMAVGMAKGMKEVTGLSPEEMEQLSKASIEGIRMVHSMGMVMKLGKRGDPIYGNAFGTMKVDDSKKFLDVQEKSIESLKKLMQSGKGMFKSASSKRLEIGGKPALEMETTYDVPNVPGPAGQQGMGQMFGAGGKTLMYYVAADEKTVVMGMGVSQERMAAALDVLKQPKKSLAEDGDVAVTAAMLPAESQWVAYVSFRGYMQFTQRALEAAMKGNPAAEQFTLPQFPKSPPLGIAVKGSSNELLVEFAVPSRLVEATGEYMKEMQAMIMKRMMEQNDKPVP